MLKLIPFQPLPFALDLVADLLVGSQSLTITYTLSGALDRVQLTTGTPLWKHTCFEFFLAGAGTAYTEWNFAPAGTSAASAFSDYRQKVQDLSATVAACTFRKEEGAFTLTAQIKPPSVPTPFRGSLTAVIELTDGSLTYWAVKHTRSQPDFHAPESFLALQTALP